MWCGYELHFDSLVSQSFIQFHVIVVLGEEFYLFDFPERILTSFGDNRVLAVPGNFRLHHLSTFQFNTVILITCVHRSQGEK